MDRLFEGKGSGATRTCKGLVISKNGCPYLIKSMELFLVGKYPLKSPIIGCGAILDDQPRLFADDP